MTRSALGVATLFCCLYLLPLGFRPMTVPDESRYSEIPREMIASGDWVVPRLNGVRYFEKPILGYWVNAVSITIFGQNRFAVRLPAALATGLTALMVLVMVRRFTRTPEAGILAAAAYLTCIAVFALGVINILDSLLTLFLTLAMGAFFYAYQAERVRTRALGLALLGVCCGLAFLVKGFLAFVVPVVSVVPFMAWEGRLKGLFKAVWIPVLTAVLVALPWCIMIHVREGDFWNYFFWTEHISRFLSPIPGQHPEPFWYFIPVLVGGALPWTALIPAAYLGAKPSWINDRFIRFVLCWLIFPFLFFSVSSGKLIPYILPCFPPLVILITVGVRDYLRAGGEKAFTHCVAAFGTVLAVLALLLAFMGVTDVPGGAPYDPTETWKWIMGVLGLSVWSALTFMASRARNTGRKLGIFCAAPVLMYLSVHLALPNQVLEGRAPQELLERNVERVREDSLVVSDEYLVHAVCWVFDRTDIYLLERPGELDYGLEHDPEGTLRLLSLDRFRDLVENAHRPEVVLVVEADRYGEYLESLPAPLFEDRDNGVLFRVF